MNDRHIGTVNYVNIEGSHHCRLSGFPEAISQFLREYYAGATIKRSLLDEVVKYCDDNEELLGWSFGLVTSGHHRRWSQRRALKYIIQQLEMRNAEISEELYSCLTESMIDDNTGRVQRIFFDETFSGYLILQENRYQLSQGTTGLSCWQASCDLANYLLKFGGNYISGKNVLELGTGCGLVGIALAASGFVKSVTVSDGNNDVLNMVRDNIRGNFANDCDNLINAIFLEWEAVNVKNVPVVPNVIVAADVVYDPSAISPFVGAVRELLTVFTKEGNSDLCCVIANTLRNQDTMDKFLSCAGDNGLLVKNYFTYEDNMFQFAAENVEDQSLFPFTSSISCPTVFHELILNG